MNQHRIKTILVLTQIIWASQVRAAPNAAFILPSGVMVKIVEATFNKHLFQITGCGESDTGCLINGRPPFGTDSGLPKTYVKSITVSYQGQSYSLDVSDMYNAWGGRTVETKNSARYFGGKCFDSKNCQFRGVFSDAAGSFAAEWKIVNGAQTRTVLTDSGDVVNLFLNHIDPPEFN